ncbi:DUF4065 domain-containing protein [candidate division WWE3 bacterium]|nr:DUF4065 domain-containing protein [candidate division WWE3 bacterium]
MYLNKLAETILKYNHPKKISKVNFAKTIYLVHKYLCQNKKSKNTAIKYIRMPLGPVPKGFMDLHNHNKNIKVSIRNTENDLLYNTENYSIENREIEHFAKDTELEIKKLAKALQRFPTSKLVDYTHKEPSWKKRKNGEEYFIQKEDLKRKLPNVRGRKRQKTKENSRIQAQLLEGLLEDIVTESTKLEYPDLNQDGKKSQ